MTFIDFENVGITFPIYNVHAYSLKKRLLRAATGGKVGEDQQGRVVVQALQDLSFRFEDGARVGIVGHNGAGKSTLLRLLSGVYEPSSGTATIQGQTGSLIDILIGIDPEATGRENIYFRGGLLGLSKAEIRNRMDEIIDFSELGDFVDMPLRTYSTGMHLRLAFTVSTIVRPEILLMDEWLSVGDENFKHKAERRMTDLVQSTNILFLASHDPELILNVCNHVIWLEHGCICMSGAPKDVIAAYFEKK